MASYTTGKSPSPTSVELSERMATLAGASCLGTTPVKYHAIRFSIIVGAPVLAALATSASMGPELVAKVLVWFILTEFAGFGGADGQLGDGHTLLTPLWFRLTPGTLRQTPFDDPGKPVSGRVPLDAVLLVANLATATAALVTVGEMHVGALRTFAVAYTGLCLRDWSAWCGGQGKHFYPLLVSAAFCADGTALPAMQLVQFCQIFFSGLCKLGPVSRPGAYCRAVADLHTLTLPTCDSRECGPSISGQWWINVVPTMCGMAPFLPSSVRALMFADAAKGDASPSGYAMLLAAFAVLVEVGAPLLWLLGGPSASRLGVLAVGGMHTYIILANPLGGIGEWNAVNIFFEGYLFAHHAVPSPPSALLSTPPPAVVLFLLLSQCVAPLLGNLRPDAMSYLLAIRNYSGNHATQIFAARATALHKLNQVPGAYALLSSPDAADKDPSVNPHKRPTSTPPNFEIDGLLGGLGTLARARGNTKCLGWLLENWLLPRGPGGKASYCIISLPQFCNQTVTEIDFGSPGLLRTLAKTCALEPGDLLSLRISSYPLLPDVSTGLYRCHWSIVDAADALAADPAAAAPPLPPGAPPRYGLFGRTTASLLWDLAGDKKGAIECALRSGFFEGKATAWQWGHEGEKKSFDAQGREVAADKKRD